MKYLVACILCFLTSVASAQSLPVFFVNGERANQQLFRSAPEKLEENKLYGEQRLEPRFPEIQFYELEPPATLQTRIESIVHGISLSLPPEYDYYGYEIRRYMAGVGGDPIFADPEKLARAITDTRRAAMALDRWEEAMNAKMLAIGEEVEATQAGSPERLDLKFKTHEARNFFAKCREWIAANEAMLNFLGENYGQYEYVAPVFNFSNKQTLEKFVDLHAARDEARAKVHEYAPFRMMIY